MKKKIILSTLAATFLASSLNASALSNRVYKLEKIIITQQKAIKTLKKQQAKTQKLEKELKSLKAEHKKTLELLAGMKKDNSSSNTADIEADIEDIDERLEIVETRSFTDKIKLGLGMRVEMNNYTNTYADDSDYTANDIWRTKLNINMKSKIADNLKFTGRLSMYKNWGDSTARNTNYDSMQGRKPDDSTVYVERAYLDWTINPGSSVPFILTLGRQPSSDGPSYQIKEDMSRKGTYDALAADGAADGIVMTTNLNSIITGTSFRIAYGTPNVLDNEAYSAQQMDYNGKDSSTFESTKVTGYFLEKTCPSLSFGSLLQIYYMDANYLDANPQLLDPTNNYQSIDKNVGDMDLVGAMVEFTKIGGSFDIFAHYSHNTMKPNGQTVDLSSIGGSATTGLLTSTSGDTEEKTGNAYWLGTRYAVTKDWKIGAEYNKGSKNWFSFTSGANDPLNKLATRGSAVEIYVSKAVNKNANIRVGYVDINYDYTGSGSHLGTPMEIDTLPDAYKSQIIEETSNLYITFNVLF